jgi:carbon storage regulator
LNILEIAMLVISRKAEEFLQIGENIVVKVIKTSNGSVKIGIEAPGGLRVLRGELIGEVGELAAFGCRAGSPPVKTPGTAERRQVAEAL